MLLSFIFRHIVYAHEKSEQSFFFKSLPCLGKSDKLYRDYNWWNKQRLFILSVFVLRVVNNHGHILNVINSHADIIILSVFAMLKETVAIL